MSYCRCEHCYHKRWFWNRAAWYALCGLFFAVVGGAAIFTVLMVFHMLPCDWYVDCAAWRAR